MHKAVGQAREDIYMGTLFGVVAGLLGAILLARYIKSILFGLEPFEIAKLLQERGAILQSVREGIIAVDQESRITLINKAALRLLQKGRPCKGAAWHENGRIFASLEAWTGIGNRTRGTG
ncbi:hypothetical protein GCM10020331_036990 [Ectobacillus funiculus]